MAGMAHASQRGISGVNKEPQRAGVRVSTTFVCLGGPEVSEDKVHSSRSVRILLLTHDAQVKLVFFLRRGILNVVASLTALS